MKFELAELKILLKEISLCEHTVTIKSDIFKSYCKKQTSSQKTSSPLFDFKNLKLLQMVSL